MLKYAWLRNSPLFNSNSKSAEYFSTVRVFYLDQSLIKIPSSF